MQRWLRLCIFDPSHSSVSSSVLSFRLAILGLSFHLLAALRLDAGWHQLTGDSACHWFSAPSSSSLCLTQIYTSFSPYSSILHREESHCSHTVAVACDSFFSVRAGLLASKDTKYTVCNCVTCFRASPFHAITFYTTSSFLLWCWLLRLFRFLQWCSRFNYSIFHPCTPGFGPQRNFSFTLDNKPHQHLAFDFSGKGCNCHSFPVQSFKSSFKGDLSKWHIQIITLTWSLAFMLPSFPQFTVVIVTSKMKHQKSKTTSRLLERNQFFPAKDGQMNLVGVEYSWPFAEILPQITLQELKDKL